ncbi:MAG: DNA-directed RNA polymerase subunit beta', partial [Bacilli bacterium]
TWGKILFNTIFPKRSESGDFPYINEPTLDNLTKGTNDRFFIGKGVNIKEEVSSWISEITAHKLSKQGTSYDKVRVLPHPFQKKFLSLIIAEVFKKFKLAETSRTLDKMKDLGFKYSTVSGITVSAYDINPIETKKEVLEEAEKKISNLEDQLRMGMLTSSEKRKLQIDIWSKTKTRLENDIKEKVQEEYIENHLYMMSDSGARGSIGNFVQLSGMRGLMAKPNGESMDIPIRSSFREGLTMSEFFISSHGSRKGSTDTALKTAESGYLTRRLVDVSQEVVVREDDCGTDKGMDVSELREKDGRLIEPLIDRIRGRYANKPVYHPETNKLIVGADEYINDYIAEEICEAGIKTVNIRTLLTCNSKNGVCVKCYGSDLSTGEVVEKGEVVGIIAAQSIGEPGTQLTMRTFHSGGVAGGDDITQGLPRIQELFEAREPKGKAIISEINGKVLNITQEKDNRYEITIEHRDHNGKLVYNNGKVEVKVYLTDSGKLPIIKKNDFVKAGDKLTEGLIHPKELLKVSSVEAVVDYILVEVQKVYRSQGVEISDKHIEIIIKQMLQKVIVVNEGDTDCLPGAQISRAKLVDIVYECAKSGKKPPVVKSLLLGITRASLKSDSFLSAASFQETTRVLTEAAIRGKKDMLEGLKENIVIGGLIPAGTGSVTVTEDMVRIIEQE